MPRILDKSGCHKPIRRLWISSVTDKAIRDGFHNLKDGRDYDNLYRAAVARAEADWLVGINGTRALTCKHNAQLSCGRVQTPTLAIIARREEEIRKFKTRGLLWSNFAGWWNTVDMERCEERKLSNFSERACGGDPEEDFQYGSGTCICGQKA